jgi:ribose transport system ATP-binding protein
MKVLSGALSPDSGTMHLDGQPYAPDGPLSALRRGIAMIYQELNLAPDLTVAQNVMLGREPRRFGWVDADAMRDEARRALTRLGHAQLPVDRRVAELGPAERQLVEIARALSARARVVVMDEPTSSLSASDAEHLFEVVGRLRDDGVAVIYISHFLEEITRLADRYVVLRDGRSVAAGEMAGASAESLIEPMTGRAVDTAFPRIAHAPGEVVLELHALSGRRLPQAASVSLRRGEILGIAGLVGAGRTELLRALYGLDPVRSGRVRIAGHEDAGAPPRVRLAQGVGLLSEDRKAEGLAQSMSIADNLTLTHLPRLSRLGVLQRRARSERVEHWMQSLGVRAAGPAAAVSSLSGGNQQKVALGRLLDLDADVLLLDEPTRGIDVGSKAEIYRMVGELAARGKAIIFVSSYLPELLGVCDRIAVMHRGRIGQARDVADWSESSLLAAATMETGMEDRTEARVV